MTTGQTGAPETEKHKRTGDSNTHNKDEKEIVVELGGIEPPTSTLPVPKLRVTTIHNEPQSYIDCGALRKLQGLDATE